MIDYERSAVLNGMEVESLKDHFERFPMSGKKVWRVCDVCGEATCLRYCDYHDMCRRCANSTVERREKMSELTTKHWEAHPELRDEMSIRMSEYWSNSEHIEEQSERITEYFKNPEHREEASERMIKYHLNHPEMRIEHSDWLIEYYKDNPEACINLSLVKSKWWEDNPDAHDEMSIRMLNYWSDPEHQDAQSLRKIEYWIDPKHRDEQSDRKAQFYKDHPEAREKHSKRIIQHFIDNPEARKRMSAIHQGIPYEEWTGFSERYNNYKNCTFLNDPFLGCHRHHITETIIICIPWELHMHIYHCLKTNYNMGEINTLALQFINGGL